MRIENPKLLVSYVVPGNCWLCGEWCRTLCAHHVLPRSRCRLDISINLVATAIDPFGRCKCHKLHHDKGTPSEDDFRHVVAEREGTTLWAIQDVMTILQQLPKSPPAAMVELRLSELDGESYKLALRVFRELKLIRG